MKKIVGFLLLLLVLASCTYAPEIPQLNFEDYYYYNAKDSVKLIGEGISQKEYDRVFIFEVNPIDENEIFDFEIALTIYDGVYKEKDKIILEKNYTLNSLAYTIYDELEIHTINLAIVYNVRQMQKYD